MKIRKSIAGATIALLVGGGLALASAIPASAHTHGVTATCEDGLTVDLTNYHPTIPGEDAVPGTPAIPGAHHDAVGEPTITIDNPDYVPGTPDTTKPGGFEKWTWTNPEKGKGEPAGPPPGAGWHDVGQTNDSKGNTPDTVLHQGNGYGSWFYFETLPDIVIPGTPAQGEPTITVPNPDYKPAYDDPETPAVPGKDAVPEQHNHITITRDGEPLVDSDFSTTFQENYPTPDKTVGHTYHVVVTSLDGIGAFTQDLSTDACVVVPPQPGDANPAATIDTSCGLAHVNLTNDGENILTASFVVYVDGDFYGAYAVEAGDHQQVDLSFGEDTGDHTVVVRTGPAQGDEKLAEATVKSDCKPAVVTPPTTPPATPSTPTKPVVPGPALLAASPAPQPTQLVAEDVLAHTGSNGEFGWIGFGAALFLLGGLLTAVAYGTSHRTPKPRYRRTQG